MYLEPADPMVQEETEKTRLIFCRWDYLHPHTPPLYQPQRKKNINREGREVAILTAKADNYILAFYATDAILTRLAAAPCLFPSSSVSELLYCTLEWKSWPKMQRRLYPLFSCSYSFYATILSTEES